MRYCGRLFVLFFTLTLIGAGLLTALVPPPKGTAKPDFDVRYSLQEGMRVLPNASFTSAQQEALENLNRSLGGGLQYDLNRIGGVPRHMFRDGGPLTYPNPRDPIAIARKYLKTHTDIFLFSDQAIDEMVVTKNYITEHNRFRTVWLNQTVNGIPVFEGNIRFSIDPIGRIWWVDTGEARPNIKLDTVPLIAAETAVGLAANNVAHPAASPIVRTTPLGSARTVMTKDRTFRSAPTAELMVFPSSQGGRLAWYIILDCTRAEWYQFLVDAQSGDILYRRNLYSFVKDGLVFNCEHPDTWNGDGRGCKQTLESFDATPISYDGWLLEPPFTGTLALPWATVPMSFQWTQGNNTDVKEDFDGDDEDTPGAHADGGPNQEFRFPFNDYYALTGDANMALQDLPAAAANVFFWMNTIHDYFYSLGFDEGAGNFQLDNFGKGGAGMDYILVDLFDAASQWWARNNAYFGSGGDGSAGRIGVYLWDNGSGAYRDPSFDPMVIMHEAAHGLSGRITSGMAGCLGGLPQSGAIGEAISDFIPAAYFNDPVMAAYSSGNVNGIRTAPYDVSTLTYANMCQNKSWFPPDGCEVHYDGEIMATFLWDLKEALGDPLLASQMVVDALKNAPCQPTYIDIRNSLLLVDQMNYGGAHECLIWNLAAQRGMGFDAKGDWFSQMPDFAVPDFNTHPKCGPSGFPRYQAHAADDTAGGNGDGVLAPGETINLTITLNNNDGAAAANSVSATISTTQAEVTILTDTASYPSIPVGGTADNLTPFVFRLEPNYPCGIDLKLKLHITWDGIYQRDDTFTVLLGQGAATSWIDDVESGGTFTPSGSWTVSNAENHTSGGANSYFTGTGVDSECFALLSSPVTVPYSAGFQGAELALWAKYNLEYCWDGVLVEISQDRGHHWSSIDMGYTGMLYNNSGCGYAFQTPVISGPPGNGSFQDWTLFRGDLTPFLGKTILIRITYTSDQFTTFGGAYIDDIQIRSTNCKGGTYPAGTIVGETMNDTIAGACTDTDGHADPGETVDYTITLLNSGTGPSLNTMGTLSSTNPNIIGVAMGPVSFGDIAPGATAAGTFRFSVAPDPAVACLEKAPMTLAVTANGGADSFQINYPITLRIDDFTNTGTAGSWQDDFNSGLPAWTPSLGPDGTVQDWHLTSYVMDCFYTAGTLFWATGPGIDPNNCGTGEPDYSADSDSLLTSPPIDLGAPNQTLTWLRWRAFFNNGGSDFPNVQEDGFSEVLIDHDGDGVFTSLARQDGGLGYLEDIDIENNPAGSVIDPFVTTQFVRIQFRFRAIAPDPGGIPGRALGWSLHQVTLDWDNTKSVKCDIIPCGPGIRADRGNGSVGLSPAGGQVQKARSSKTSGR